MLDFARGENAPCDRSEFTVDRVVTISFRNLGLAGLVLRSQPRPRGIAYDDVELCIKVLRNSR